MKKTLLTIGLLTAITASAQNVVTFEELTLAPNTANDVSDDGGSFVSGGVTFKNLYDTQYDYWASGISYSNQTNTTTQGYVSESCSFAGSGADNSANFGVFSRGTELSVDFGTEKVVTSIMITNTTYAGLSMTNGDIYAKKFGTLNNAQGTPDGTEGKDFFFVRIIGMDADTLATDTVIFYLADFRGDNTQDYILNEWETVDLSSLGNVRFLEFELESSDTGEYGMNTPAYFAFDNLAFGTLGVNELTETFSMFPNPANDNVTIKGNAGLVKIFDATGKLVATEITNGFISINTADWNSGLYIVELTTENGTGRSTLVKK